MSEWVIEWMTKWVKDRKERIERFQGKKVTKKKKQWMNKLTNERRKKGKEWRNEGKQWMNEWMKDKKE